MYLAIKVEQDFNIKEFIKSIKPTLHATNAGMISKGKDFAIIVSCVEYFIFYTKDEFLENYRNENKFIIKIELKRVEDFILNKNKQLTKEELIKAFSENKIFLIKELLNKGLFSDYNVISIDSEYLRLKDNFNKKEIKEKLDLDLLISSISQYYYLNKIFDSIGLSKYCLEKTEDYDKRVLELGKEIAKLKYNIEDYEFRITDGSLEEKDLYYIVCWVNKTHYQKNENYLKTNISFKCRSEKEGDCFIIELSEYPKFNYLIRSEEFNEEEDLYSLYLTYLYTRNLERLDF